MFTLRTPRRLYVYALTQSLPFPQGRKHATGLALGVTTFFGLGFGLPLVVVYYQLYVACLS